MAKRGIDIVVGTVLALASLPLIVVFAIGVCLSLRTWRPVFHQERVGMGGRRFTLIKLRTLPPTAPAAADKFTVAAMVTSRLGRFLRRSHLDELPQLLLVPIGRMSLVGPRPEMPWLLDTFDPAFVDSRCEVRPGCTGLWQVGVAAAGLIGDAPEYDLFYLRHHSVRLDAWIAWQSLRVVVGGRPVSFADVPRWAQRRAPTLSEVAADPAVSAAPILH